MQTLPARRIVSVGCKLQTADPTSGHNTQLFLPPKIRVLGVEEWFERLDNENAVDVSSEESYFIEAELAALEESIQFDPVANYCISQSYTREK